MALHLLEELPSLRFEANVISVSSAISACQRATQWERALLLVHSLPERRLHGNAVAYNAAAWPDLLRPIKTYFTTNSIGPMILPTIAN